MRDLNSYQTYLIFPPIETSIHTDFGRQDAYSPHAVWTSGTH
jgi:hypothetical protein